MRQDRETEIETETSVVKCIQEQDAGETHKAINRK